jgi:hypothetical protein
MMPGPARRCFACSKPGATVCPDNRALYAMWFHEGCEPKRPVKRKVPSADTRIENAAPEPRVGDRVRIGVAFRRGTSSEVGRFRALAPDEWVGKEGVVERESCAIGGAPTLHVRLDDGREAVVRSYRCRRIA